MSISRNVAIRYKQILSLICATVLFLANNFEAKSLTPYHYITVTVAKQSSGCGITMTMDNPYVTPWDNDANIAHFLVKDQDNYVMYEQIIWDIGVFAGRDTTFNINLLPGQTEMRWEVHYHLHDKAGTVTNFACCLTEPSINWINIQQSFPVGLTGYVVNATLNIPAGFGCITHFVVATPTDNEVFSGLYSIPNGNGPKSMPLPMGYVEKGKYSEYIVLLISNVDMHIPYNYGGNAYNNCDHYYCFHKSLQQGRHFYKQSIAENSFGNAVQTYFSNNVLRINADLEPEKAENLILNIYNAVGTPVATETFELTGNSSFGYEIQNLQRGAYFFTLTTNSGEIVHRDKLMVTE